MTTIYSQFMKEGSTAFDIGAYGGARTDMLLEAGCSTVVAVEPVFEYWLRLKEKYKGDARVHALWCAAGAEIGLGMLHIHKAQWPNGVPMDSALSSMSEEWINSVEEHPEWGLDRKDWSEEKRILVVTLDSLIESYGEPDFIKIDVEGYEKEVIRGLSKPVKALSFEFHSTLHMDWTEQAIDHLLKLGNYEFNFDIADTMELQSTSWFDKAELFWHILDKDIYGDIYARLA